MFSLPGQQPFPVSKLYTGDCGIAVDCAVQIPKGAAKEKGEYFRLNTVPHFRLRNSIPTPIAHLFEVAAAV
jgi:hypothetical protein